jgi:hypothetical protein
MDNGKLQAVRPAARAAFEQVQTTMNGVVRRQCWISSSAVLVMLILTVGIASFSFPGLLSEQKEFYTLNLAVRVWSGLFYSSTFIRFTSSGKFIGSNSNSGSKSSPLTG